MTESGSAKCGILGTGNLRVTARQSFIRGLWRKRFQMNFERERISNTLVEAMLYHDCATGMVVQTLHQVRKLYEECVMENYTSTF